jgi:hypothetical protein
MVEIDLQALLRAVEKVSGARCLLAKMSHAEGIGKRKIAMSKKTIQK